MRGLPYNTSIRLLVRWECFPAWVASVEGAALDIMAWTISIQEGILQLLIENALEISYSFRKEIAPITWPSQILPGSRDVHEGVVFYNDLQVHLFISAYATPEGNW